jgi:hypothetical protein
LKPVPLPPAGEKQNTALKQSQLINPLDLLMCCVTLEGGGERIEKADDKLPLHPGPILSDCFYLMSRTFWGFSPSMFGLGSPARHGRIPIAPHGPESGRGYGQS